MNENKKEPAFEENLARLEEIVRLLERGEVPLAESLSLFEEGTKLAAACQGALQSAEQLVVKLQRAPAASPSSTPSEGRHDHGRLSDPL